MRRGRKPTEECIDCESDNIEVIELLGVYVDDVSKKIFVKYLRFLKIRLYNITH